MAKTAHHGTRADDEAGFCVPKGFYGVVEDISRYEAIFYARCKLDASGRRTNEPRVMPRSEFNPYQPKTYPRG